MDAEAPKFGTLRRDHKRGALIRDHKKGPLLVTQSAPPPIEDPNQGQQYRDNKRDLIKDPIKVPN